MSTLWDHLVDALAEAGSMTWQIAWSLVFGFAVASIIQALVHRDTIGRLLGDDRPRTLAKAAGFGIASSSCSYAAVALARSLFRKGATFTAAIVFEIASTNLVVELGVILALLLGWQFTLAEFVGGPLVIVMMALIFRFVVRGRLIEAAREQADKALAGSMEGHAAMDMSVGGQGSLARRLFSKDGVTSVSHIFVMEWAAVLRDVVVGLLIAGAVAAWVPDTFWRHLFITNHATLAKVWGPLGGPVIAMFSFVCSIGNVPLAGVLYNSGISFGGVVSFLFADLIIVPILLIYRKYYGTRMMLTLLAAFYATMVVAGYVVEVVFGALHLVPEPGHAKVMTEAISWNYTTYLNIVAAVVAVSLVVRFYASGAGSMLHMMNGDPDDPDDPDDPGDMAGHDHGQHDHGQHDHGQHDTGLQDHPLKS